MINVGAERKWWTIPRLFCLRRSERATIDRVLEFLDEIEQLQSETRQRGVALADAKAEIARLGAENEDLRRRLLGQTEVAS